MQVTQQSKALYLVQKKCTGFVLGRTPNECVAAVATIVEELSSDIKIPLDIANRRYLFVVSPQGNVTGREYVMNQVTVTLQRYTSRPQGDPAPLIGAVTLDKENIT
jgi:hypothetical protein